MQNQPICQPALLSNAIRRRLKSQCFCMCIVGFFFKDNVNEWVAFACDGTGPVDESKRTKRVQGWSRLNWLGGILIIVFWHIHDLETLRKKLATHVTLLRRLADSEWGADAKTLRTSTLSLVYPTAEYCAPVRCRSAHTRLIDTVLNDALRIVTGCLRPTPTDHLPILSGIQQAELRR